MFVAVKENATQPNKSGAYYQSDVDVVPATKTSQGGDVAQDVLSCVATPKSETCSVALAAARGILESNFTVKFSNGKLTGTITGGTGAFSGATGVITGKPSALGESVTITYST